MKEENIIDLHIKGYTILKGWVSEKRVDSINNKLPKLFNEHKKIREENNNGIISEGVAMNVLASDDIFIDFIQEMIDRGLIDSIEKNYFKDTCILNSLTALSNLKTESNLFYKKVHRDIRGYSGDVPILLNLLVMLDDFTAENGGTLLLPYSHLKKEEPNKKFWEENCKQMTGKAGDIVIWNSNIFHASGINKTSQIRKGLPITFSLPYYKQLLDYPRAIGYERQMEFSEKTQQILGYNSRVPSTVNEWYSSPNKRFYKK
jgi:ectoine hydroxylase-related dioxygenase (phytanoyl-CoA dioxygenase family)